MGDSPGLTRARARPRVIVLPAELNIANVGLFGEQLDSALVPGVTVVIADMTDTTDCDSWGIRMLAVAIGGLPPTTPSCGWWCLPRRCGTPSH